MKKTILLLLLNLGLLQFGFSQQLQNTTWTTFWGAPINDDISLTFGTDTLFVTGSAGNEIITTAFSENEDSVTIQDFSGPFSCPMDQIGIYQFAITDGTSLDFSAVEDPCDGRVFFITNNSLTRENLTDINAETFVKFDMYPNPTSDNLFINSQGSHNFQLFDQVGRTIVSSLFINQVSINISTLPKGLYLVKVDDTTQKLIIN